MASQPRPPILLLGNTRSGTTIVQKLVAVHPDVVSWYEPRTVWLYADPGRPHDAFDAADATPRVKRYVRRQFLARQQSHGGGRVLEKTPANVLKIPYVMEIFPEATVLFIVRNPFSFISSVESKWQRPVTARGIRRRLVQTPVSQLHHYAGRFVGQVGKRLSRRKYLPIWGPRYPGIREDLQRLDLLTVIARQWSECSRRAEAALAQLGEGRVLRLRYEDFVEDPVADLRRICAHCGLELTDDMRRAAEEWVAPDRQRKWERFDPRDLARLLPELQDEMQRHGYGVPPEIARAAGQAAPEAIAVGGP